MALRQWPHLLLANSKRLCEDRVFVAYETPKEDDQAGAYC